MAEYFRAREAFTYTSKSGIPKVVTPGDLISSDDPDYAGREHLYEPVADSVDRARSVTETATAAPGEVRSLHRRGRRPKAQPDPTPEPPAEGSESESELS